MPRASVVPFGQDIECPCCKRTLARKGAIRCPRCKTDTPLTGDFGKDLVGDQLLVAFLWKLDGSQASAIYIRKEIWWGSMSSWFPRFFVYNGVDPSKTLPMRGCRVNDQPFDTLDQALAVAREHEDAAIASKQWVYVEGVKARKGVR